ncbi:hypothetical protein JCM8547_005173 [Rhodosporidiobolus lusitaniae]
MVQLPDELLEEVCALVYADEDHQRAQSPFKSLALISKASNRAGLGARVRESDQPRSLLKVKKDADVTVKPEELSFPWTERTFNHPDDESDLYDPGEIPVWPDFERLQLGGLFDMLTSLSFHDPLLEQDHLAFLLGPTKSLRRQLKTFQCSCQLDSKPKVLEAAFQFIFDALHFFPPHQYTRVELPTAEYDETFYNKTPSPGPCATRQLRRKSPLSFPPLPLSPKGRLFSTRPPTTFPFTNLTGEITNLFPETIETLRFSVRSAPSPLDAIIPPRLFGDGPDMETSREEIGWEEGEWAPMTNDEVEAYRLVPYRGPNLDKLDLGALSVKPFILRPGQVPSSRPSSPLCLSVDEQQQQRKRRAFFTLSFSSFSFPAPDFMLHLTLVDRSSPAPGTSILPSYPSKPPLPSLLTSLKPVRLDMQVPPTPLSPRRLSTPPSSPPSFSYPRHLPPRPVHLEAVDPETLSLIEMDDELRGVPPTHPLPCAYAAPRLLAGSDAVHPVLPSPSSSPAPLPSILPCLSHPAPNALPPTHLLALHFLPSPHSLIPASSNLLIPIHALPWALASAKLAPLLAARTTIEGNVAPAQAPAGSIFAVGSTAPLQPSPTPRPLPSSSTAESSSSTGTFSIGPFAPSFPVEALHARLPSSSSSPTSSPCPPPHASSSFNSDSAIHGGSIVPAPAPFRSLPADLFHPPPSSLTATSPSTSTSSAAGPSGPPSPPHSTGVPPPSAYLATPQPVIQHLPVVFLPSSQPSSTVFLPSAEAFSLLHRWVYDRDSPALWEALVNGAPSSSGQGQGEEEPPEKRLARIANLWKTVVVLEVADEEVWGVMAEAWEEVVSEVEGSLGESEEEEEEESEVEMGDDEDGVEMEEEGEDWGQAAGMVF